MNAFHLNQPMSVFEMYDITTAKTDSAWVSPPVT